MHLFFFQLIPKQRRLYLLLVGRVRHISSLADLVVLQLYLESPAHSSRCRQCLRHEELYLDSDWLTCLVQVQVSPAATANCIKQEHVKHGGY